MTTLSIPALIMAVIAFYVGSYHLLIYSRRPGSRVDLTFALTAICIGFYDVFCVALYNVTSPAQGVAIQRWQLISLALFSISMMWFVVDYTSMKSRSGPRIFSVIFLLFALIGLFDHSGLAWTDQPLIKKFLLPFGDGEITYFEMEFGPAMLLEGFFLMVFYLYLYLIAVHFYWRKNPVKAKPLVLAIALFMAGMTEDVFVAFGYYNFIYTIEYSFMGMILVMAYTLSSEIIEKGRIKQALSKSENRYRNLVEETNDMITRVDARGIFTFVNRMSEKYIGLRPDECPGVSAFDFIHPDDQGMTDAWFSECLAKKLPAATIENRLVNPQTGNIFNMLWTTSFHYDENGEIIDVSGSARDITDRKHAEEALRQSESQHAKMVANIGDVIVIIDQAGNNQYKSPNIEKWFGWKPEDLIGRGAVENVHPEDQEAALQFLGALLAEPNAAGTTECRYRCKDGSYKWIEFTGVNLLHDPDIRGILGNYSDITTRKQAEEEQAKLETHLRQAYKMEAVGTMAGGIAHDFNNILAIILGNADMALDDLPDQNPARMNIDQIVQASNRAKDLVRQILAFSRQSEQKLLPIEPGPIIKESLKLLRSTIPTTVSIVQNIGADLGTIMADPTQIHQLFMNLFANAVHAMDEKGTLEVTGEQVALQAGDIDRHADLKPGRYIRLSVRDTGTGMNNDTRERIFDPFFTTKAVDEGTGMGLAIVMGIVQSHGGLITVASAPGEGTTFHIFFPIVAKQAGQQAEAPEQLPQGNEQVLFVDDEEMLAVLGSRILEKQGYQVTVETSSQKALAIFRKNPAAFDLVITDQSMPDMSGAELAAALLEIRPDMPIILCTGYSKKISEEQARKIGIKEYCIKPLDRQQLTRAVRKVLDAAKT